MRVIYKGYAITTYGTGSIGRVSITDREGREVLNENVTTLQTEEEAKQFLKDFLNRKKQ